MMIQFSCSSLRVEMSAVWRFMTMLKYDIFAGGKRCVQKSCVKKTQGGECDDGNTGCVGRLRRSYDRL